MGWRSQVITASLVIIYGTGKNTGLFVYSGTPSASNPPIFWATSAGTDPFGNAIPSTAGVAGTGTFQAGNTVLKALGDFIYSGTPAAGNLLASITGAAGADDGHTNPFLKGITGYQGLGGSQYGVNINTGSSGGEPGLVVHNLTNPPFNDPGFFAQASGGTPKIADATMSSGQAANTDVAAFVTATSQAESGFTNGEVVVQAGETTIGVGPTVIVDDNNRAVNLANTGAAPPAPALGSSLYVTSAGNPAWINTKGQTGVVPETDANQGGNTVNATGFNAAFTPYSIKANDPQAGTAYRVTCGGHGTQATTTATTLNFRLAAFGKAAGWGSSTDNGGVAAGANFHWRFQGEIVLGGTGNNAAASFCGLMVISQAAASAAGHATAMDEQVANGTDTTVNNTITLQVGWTSTTNSPTIVCTYSTFERIGP